MSSVSRFDYKVCQSVTKTFGWNGYVKVQLENIPITSGQLQPLTLRIGDMPIVLTLQQKEHIAAALKMDETTLQVLQLLEQKVVHGDASVRHNLAQLFEG